MMFDENIKVLKGRHILAQGKRRRSAALGLRASKKIVRALTFTKEKFIFRTGVMTLCFPEMMYCISVRRKLIALFIEFSRTVFAVSFYPGRCPGLLYFGLSVRKITF